MRDWRDARAKVEREGRCRACGLPGVRGLEAAHVIGRGHDDLPGEGETIVVQPLDVVPLCAPCHRSYDAHALDLLPRLTLAEQAQAVARVGIVAAYRRTTGERP